MFNISTPSLRDLFDSMELAELNGPNTPEDELRVEWTWVATVVVSYFRASVLEDALGENFSKVLPDGYRTHVVAMRLPQHVTDAILDAMGESSQHRRGDLAYGLEHQIGYSPDPYPAFPQPE